MFIAEVLTSLFAICAILCAIWQLNVQFPQNVLLMVVLGGCAGFGILSFFAPLHEDESLVATRFSSYVRHQARRLRAVVLYPLIVFGLIYLLTLSFPSALVVPIALCGASLVALYGNAKEPSYKKRLSRMARRGHPCYTLEEANKRASLLLKNCGGKNVSLISSFLFGGIPHAPQDAQQGFLFLGNPGSGKSTAIETLLSTELPYILEGHDHRAILYDAKGDMPQFLEALGFERNVTYFILNPFDTRCVRWDIAKDCTDDALASQFASIIIPQSDSANPFFDQAAQLILGAIFRAFIHEFPERWTWRDVVNAASGNLDDLLDLVYRVPGNRECLQYYFQEPRLCASVLSTLMNYMLPYRAIASSWDKAETSISVSDFLENKFVLLLGSDPSSDIEIQRMNRVFCSCLIDKLRSKPDVPFDASRRSWIVIDETKEAGAIDSLSTALSFGRSKGLCTVLGVQDKPGLQRVFGTDRANEITDLTRHIAVFNCGMETAKWAEELFGKYETYELSTSTSGTNLNSPTSEQEGIVTREIVTSAQISSLPDPKHSNGIHGFFHSPLIHAWRAAIPWTYISMTRASRLRDFPSLAEARIDQARMRYTSWTNLERMSFGLSPEKETSLDKEELKKGISLLAELESYCRNIGSDMSLKQDKETVPVQAEKVLAG